MNKRDTLLAKRTLLRERGDFVEADRIREEIEALGYHIADENGRSFLIKKEAAREKPHGSIALFGSGEISSIGRKIHEAVLSRLNKKNVTIAILTTPAGFQPNVSLVHEEIARFFQQSLANFHPRVRIVMANTPQEANSESVASQIDDTDYLFIGPGSPTYAVRILRGSLLYNRILDRILKGVSLGVASAAAIAFSKYVLPVYEIYKVGEPLHWIEGLNFYKQVFGELSVVPHFNNTEGGLKTDTSRCFMGADRFSELLELLPKNHTVWGIDELTGVIINVETKSVAYQGKGKLHPLHGKRANVAV
ncbi:MAG: cysteinyl-tRNA synthetase [Candidatus Levybacteria bacterium]|nr:cysteinyl-tRNA synthetase [Candidatus Levybacteria bacterium]